MLPFCRVNFGFGNFVTTSMWIMLSLFWLDLLDRFHESKITLIYLSSENGKLEVETYHEIKLKISKISPTLQISKWKLKNPNIQILFSFQIAFFNGGYVFPLLLICGMYSVMLRRLWRQAPGGHASAESIRNKKRVIRMVLIVIVIFALSWLPIQVVLVLR